MLNPTQYNVKNVHLYYKIPPPPKFNQSFKITGVKNKVGIILQTL